MTFLLIFLLKSYRINIGWRTVIGSEKSTRTIVEKFTYDNNGQLTKYVDGQKNETTFKYNANEFIIFD